MQFPPRIPLPKLISLHGRSNTSNNSFTRVSVEKINLQKECERKKEEREREVE